MRVTPDSELLNNARRSGAENFPVSITHAGIDQRANMQTMECRNLREMLDSYLHGELSVETNHTVLRHLEQCPACRSEMAARRQLRDRLRTAASSVSLSAEAKARLRARLREEILPEGSTANAAPVINPARESFLSRFFKPWLMPRLAAALMVLLAVAAGSIWFFSPHIVDAAQLSQEFIREAIGDHTNCAAMYADKEKPAQMSALARQYNAAYSELDKIAELHAEGLQLHAAHLCGFAGRKFAHLVYTRGDQLISLLVTERDVRAMKKGIVPQDDGLRAGLQHEIQNEFNVSAYQTKRHVVLIVATLSERETRALAERIAAPVSQHLRRIETLPAENHQ